MCPVCYPKKYTNSKYEYEIVDYLKELSPSINIVTNTKKIISPFELDIYLPDFNLAIEFNGLHWHSELAGKTKNYHLNKTEKCKEKGIQLIHIFENEWNDNKEIIKSILKNKLKLNKNKIYARKCKIKEISNEEYNEFLFNNHIQGITKSKIKIGLFHNDSLVMISSFSKPRFNKLYEYELIRLASRKDCTIIGGMEKLLTYFVSSYNPISIISYVDRRYFSGSSYFNSNFFKYKNISSPNYWYIENGKLINRINFQKHKLKSKLKLFDSTLTEWENMQLNGYDRIWDCGNFIFEWNNIK